MAAATFTGRSNPFPTPIDTHELNCALLLAENARLMLLEAHRLLKGDYLLALRVEAAGLATKALYESTAARVEARENELSNQM